MTDDNQQLKCILEGAILAAGDPLSVQKLQSLFEENNMPEKDEILSALAEIKDSCEGRGFDLVEVSTGWRFNVREQVAPWVNKLWDEKPQKYSRALLETLALIAYRQPITRGDIEEVRGVAVSSHIIKTLTERDWIKVVGHRDVPGRPALYATTKMFLDYFNLQNLEELPSLGELKDIESLNANLEFGDSANAAEQKEGEQKEAEQKSDTSTPDENPAGDEEATSLNEDQAGQVEVTSTDAPLSDSEDGDVELIESGASLFSQEELEEEDLKEEGNDVMSDDILRNASPLESDEDKSSSESVND